MNCFKRFFNFLFGVADKTAEVAQALAPVAEAVAPLCGEAGAAVALGAKATEILGPTAEKIAEKGEDLTK